MNCVHVGATPRWMEWMRIAGLNSSARPTTISKVCVARSRMARMMLSRAASWMPTTLMMTRKTITRMPPMELYGQTLRMGQNAAR